jgi:membrane protein
MPNVKTKLSSAAFGGVIGGVLWQGLLVLHVKFQMGVASYNALYSGFAAVPIFLVWMYMSWRIVLLGAQLAASHQREQHMQQIQRARHVDQELRETLAVAMTSLAAARFLAQAAAPTQADLATLLQAPVPTVDEVLDTLVRRGILLRSVCGSELGHVPGRDIDELRLADITAAVRVDPAAEDLKKDVMETLDPRLVRLVANEARLREGNLTLRELAKLAPAPAPAPAPEATESVIDAKQPEVTS